jgi:DNA-directed RNA polymerase subunit L
MSEVTLEKIDIVRERTNASYSDAKAALEACDGNVVDAIIYMEKNKKSTFDNIYSSKDEFLTWIKDLINKGNITRIKVKKEDKTLVDMPVNAGIAVGIIAYAIWTPLIAIGVIGAVVTNLTIEITKKDGSVEVINKVIRSTMQDVKEKMSDVVHEAKSKVSDVTSDVKDKFGSKKDEEPTKDNETVYTYTVKFDDIDSDNNK